MHQYVSAEEALSIIKSNQRVFLHGCASTPNYLISKLAQESHRLKSVEIISIVLQGTVEIAKPEYKENFYLNSLFVSESVREATNSENGSYIPIFLSEIPSLFSKNTLPLDVAIIQVSPPDIHGYCSLGVSVDIARTAVDTAKHIIAQVNPKIPRTLGDSMIHIKRIDKLVWQDTELFTVDYASKIGAEERKIGEHIAEIIEDRSTLQMGVGTIPDAVLQNLGNHKDLGIHTEMLSDGVIKLIADDVINNKHKTIHKNRTITSFCLGTRKLYDYIDDNPSFSFLDVGYVNNPKIIGQNIKQVAINSAIEIDITGQVCSDSIGTRQFSGIGGQVDFMRGAALSEGGKPIIATTSRTKKGVPRIVPFLKQGAGVVTSRGDVHYVATEYGIAYLHGKNLVQRAKALIDISHPDDRENLEKATFERFGIKKFGIWN